MQDAPDRELRNSFIEPNFRRLFVQINIILSS